MGWLSPFAVVAGVCIEVAVSYGVAQSIHPDAGLLARNVAYAACGFPAGLVAGAVAGRLPMLHAVVAGVLAACFVLLHRPALLWWLFVTLAGKVALALLGGAAAESWLPSG